MRLRRFGHACVRIEADGTAIVVDSGEFSDPASIEGADALLFTHGHYDHLAVERVKAALAARPDLPVWAPADAIASSGIAEIRPLRAGDTIRAGTLEIAVSGGRHAEVYPGQDAGENLGLLIAGRIYHPGDSFALPGGPVDVLLVPIQGPWSRVSEVVDYLRAATPGQAIPIHDALLSPLGLAAFDRNISTRVPDIQYRRLADGEWLEL